MEKVCYILGAGFSRPLGLPLMSDFLSKSKDMYLKDKAKYSYFSDMFKMFDSFSRIHNFMNSDQLNIEELLSLADMKDYVQGTRSVNKVIRFLVDVINHYTPELDLRSDISSYRHYIGFISALASGEKRREKLGYSIVTLNYDIVVEKVVDRFNSIVIPDIDKNMDLARYASPVPISKLHGCVRDGNIQAPTCNKGGRTALAKHFKTAHDNISAANHIRIIGYSLPETDSYIKYLLKIAMLNIEHLKSIDVVCLDDVSGNVKKGILM